VIGDNGASRSCKQTASGTFSTLADCIDIAKCYQN
jgi:hypothetical protein